MATVGVAKPGQAMRRPRPSLSARLGSRAAAATANADAIKKKAPEPYVRDSDYVLRKFDGRPPSLTIHLHPTHFRFDQQDGSFSYDSPMKVFIQHLQKQTVPHEFIQEFLENNVVFYDGCLIVEVHNHRSSVAKAPASGNLPSASADRAVAFSMHNYHDHVTPSPFAPYPRKPSTQPSASQRPESVKPQDGPKDPSTSGPTVYTIVLHPTSQSKHHEMMLLANTYSHRNPKGFDEKDYYNFEAETLVATEPPLLLDPAATPEEAEKALELLKHPLHSNTPPPPNARKRTHLQMAADEAEAAEEERRMLIMDERTKPSLRNGAIMSAAEGQTASVALGFSRFKTLETIKKNHEENERKKKEEEAQKAMEKRQHDAQLAQKRKLMEERHRQEQAAMQQKQKMMMQQQQVMQQEQQRQQQAAQQQNALAQSATPMAQNPQQQHLQQQAALAAQSSPIVRNPTPMMASSPLMANGGAMNMGGFPMQPTASNQGAGSPPRPPSAAMQHPNIAMARQISQQSRHATPQMAHGTPQMATAIPMDGNRQMSGTPHMQHRSPVPPHMQGTPNQAAMMAGTPQMNQGLTPGQQMALMQQQQRARQIQQAQAMHGSPGQAFTPEQMTMMRNQQNMALQQQGMNPQQIAMLQQQRMQQMNNMQGGTPMMNNPSQQGMGQPMGQQQMMQNNTQHLQRAQVVQNARNQLMRTRHMMQQMANAGQQIPMELTQRAQQQQAMVQAAQQQMNAAAMRSTQQNLGDPSNTEQYMHNLRNQQALIARMQNQRNQQQAMNAAGMMNGNPQNMGMNMMQGQQMTQQQMQQFAAARQNAMNQQRPGSGMGQ